MVAQKSRPDNFLVIVDGGPLFLGSGVAKIFWEWAGYNEGHGVYAYSVNRQGS